MRIMVDKVKNNERRRQKKNEKFWISRVEKWDVENVKNKDKNKFGSKSNYQQVEVAESFSERKKKQLKQIILS